jgi:hypothetical protein
MDRILNDIRISENIGQAEISSFSTELAIC